MHKPLPSLNQSTPFFDLLADAEEIKVREVRPEALAADPASRALADSENARTFLVRIRNKPHPPAQPAAPPAADGELLTPQKREFLLRSAELLVTDADYLLARNIYSYLLKINLRDTEALRGLAVCLGKLGDFPAAKKCYRALIELTGDPVGYLRLGQCCLSVSDDKAAMAHFNQISDTSKLSREDLFDLHREMGNCETRAQNFDAAWSHYHRALELQPTSDAIHVNLGTLELQRKQPNVAQSHFNRALALNPKSSRGRCGLGLVALEKGDAQIARAEFERALELDSQNQVALFQLVAMSNTSEQSTRAKERLAIFLGKDPKHAEARYAYAVLLFRDGQWKACEDALELILSSQPEHLKSKVLREQLNHHKHKPGV